MPQPVYIPGDVVIQGNVYVAGIIPQPGAAGYLTDVLVAPSANIQATKLQQQVRHARSLANHGSAPAALRQVLGRVRGPTGTAVQFAVGLVQPLTAGSLTVDLLKNGTSILSAPVALNTTGGTGGTAYDAVAGTIAAAALAANDVLEAVVAVTGPTGGGGLYCQLTTREDPA